MELGSSWCLKTTITVQDIIRGAKCLELVGYNEQISEVIYRASEPVLLPVWSKHKDRQVEMEE